MAANIGPVEEHAGSQMELEPDAGCPLLQGYLKVVIAARNQLLAMQTTVHVLN